MKHVKYLILGAGPAGLTFARKLMDRGETSFLVLEKENCAGGLCRSVEVDGSPLDIGGGHFLDVRRPSVNEFLFRFMPQEEWQFFERDSRIMIDGILINHPFEANIWQLDLERQVDYLSSIAKAGCNSGEPVPERFVDWIKWKLGQRVAEDYMLPYNQKMFADDLNHLGVYWLEKLPNVSFEETLRSCLTHRPYGTQPGHASFYYPVKYGYGEVWLRIAESIKDYILYEKEIFDIDLEAHKVYVKSSEVYHADKIITTIPWNCFNHISGMPEQLVDDLKKLKSSAVEIRYMPKRMETDAQWIYVPDLSVPYHRILLRHNFCNNSKGYWLETRQERAQHYENNTYHYLNQYAYPLNTIGKPQIMKRVLEYARTKQVYGLGRWGEHSHYNSDLVVELAICLEEEISKR